MSDLPDELSLPDYGGACLDRVVPSLLAEPGARDAPWLPEPARHARQVVLFVLDGLGWNQLQARPHVAPTLSAMAGGPITSVAPTTTATALSSIVLGRTPAEHGVVGYRVRVEGPAILQKGGLYACVKGVVGSIRFPPSNGSQIVAYPFSLT